MSKANIRKSPIATHPNRTFVLAAYDRTWPKQFKAYKSEIGKILGSQALSIEHIGSTSIPNMLAKPQIDILVVVPELFPIKNLYADFEAAGFNPRGDYTGEGEEYFTKDNDDGQRLVSAHILPKGHVWADDLLNFRDYLRAHPVEAKRYAQAKQQAVEKHPGDYDAYYKAKLEVVQDIRQRAADWKKHG